MGLESQEDTEAKKPNFQTTAKAIQSPFWPMSVGLITGIVDITKVVMLF
jgi:hypothetical protein